MKYHTVLLLLLLGVLPGCVTTRCPSQVGQPVAVTRAHQELPSNAKVTHVAPGFYRHADEPSVYRVQSATNVCLVVNMDQMQAMGGFAQVKVVPHALNFLGIPAARVPACAWPRSAKAN